MSNHADELARLRDAVVEAAKAERALQLATGPMSSRERLHRRIPLEVSLKRAVDALIAAEALTCETCDATGGKWITTVCGDGELADFVPCPACHGTGRKPDTFRDDGATTPEGYGPDGPITPEGFEDPDDRGGEAPGA